jgi:heat-inducible transcriptional repressor
LKTWKPASIKRIGKQDRERKVLLGLVEHFIQNGKPVGSNTLKEAGFGDLSSATIRNYFAHLEENGFLEQSHSSGGRIPTDLAYRTYAQNFVEEDPIEINDDIFQFLRQFDSREIAFFLQESAETLSKKCRCAVFLSAPRFDHDFVIDLKLVPLDAFRCLCILITDLGVVQTEILHLPEKLSSFAIKRIESYFHWRLTGIDQPEKLESEEEAIGQTFYNELMLRYIVGYSAFIDEDIYRTGFSNLLAYPDFQNASLLASGLSLFENVHSMRLLLKECKALNRLKFWIGDDLETYVAKPNFSVIAIPYYINHKPVGAVGILGPTRLPYRILFSTLRLFSESVSETLTRTIYKFKISFRQPQAGKPYLQKEETRLIGQSRLILLEDKRVEDSKEIL